jgi:hypothetical protein
VVGGAVTTGLAVVGEGVTGDGLFVGAIVGRAVGRNEEGGVVVGAGVLPVLLFWMMTVKLNKEQ